MGPPGGRVFFCLTWALGPWYEKHFGKHDPQEVVIDEVSGYLVTVGIPILAGTTWPAWLVGGVGFALFRVLDIAKPFPISRAEKLKGGLGVAADDVVAGCFAGVLVLGIAHLLPCVA